MRFVTQYPHVSGGYAVIDTHLGALVVVLDTRQQAKGVVDVLNGVLRRGVLAMTVTSLLDEASPWQVAAAVWYLSRLLTETCDCPAGASSDEHSRLAA